MVIGFVIPFRPRGRITNAEIVGEATFLISVDKINPYTDLDVQWNIST